MSDVHSRETEESGSLARDIFSQEPRVTASLVIDHDHAGAVTGPIERIRYLAGWYAQAFAMAMDTAEGEGSMWCAAANDLLSGARTSVTVGAHAIMVKPHEPSAPVRRGGSKRDASPWHKLTVEKVRVFGDGEPRDELNYETDHPADCDRLKYGEVCWFDGMFFEYDEKPTEPGVYRARVWSEGPDWQGEYDGGNEWEVWPEAPADDRCRSCTGPECDGPGEPPWVCDPTLQRDADDQSKTWSGADLMSAIEALDKEVTDFAEHVPMHANGQAEMKALHAALRVLSSIVDPEEHANSAAEAEYADEQLALAARDLVTATDAMPADDQPVGWDPNSARY